MKRRQGRIRDVNRVAFEVVHLSTDEAKSAPEPEKNPAAVALGRLGGLAGGRARALKLSAKKRHEIAKRAANCRWNQLPNQNGS